MTSRRLLVGWSILFIAAGCGPAIEGYHRENRDIDGNLENGETGFSIPLDKRSSDPNINQIDRARDEPARIP